jgi:NTP pyrophosphatase (non-canonical NTP hydrolase)
LSELQKELCKALRGRHNRENIIEEFADVIIMLDQIKMYFSIKDDEIRNIIAQKIERTEKRLLK